MGSDNENSLHDVCCLLMASLFALSTCFQFNDPDWYFWIPLYSSACIVNLLKWGEPNSSRIRKLGRFGLWLGLFLFIKVAVEDLVYGTRFWSLDMRERVLREKFGSGLVVCSMFLVLENSSISKYGKTAKDLSNLNIAHKYHGRNQMQTSNGTGCLVLLPIVNIIILLNWCIEICGIAQV